MIRYNSKPPQGIGSIAIHLSEEAMIWLTESTVNTDNEPVKNLTLFLDLLSRMRIIEGVDTTHRRPQLLLPFQAQIAENNLEQEWGLGRKRIHNRLTKMEQLGLIKISGSTVATVITFTCVQGFGAPDFKSHPFYRSPL
ncbi:MAG: hypothetical protein LIP02_02855 [Bacteroidales bacterium]|nr:hypothetical protein [Bacteroidales bacterium]